MKLKIIIRSLSASFLLVCSMNAQAFNIDPEIDSCIKKNAPKASVIERIKMTSESLMSEEDDVLAAKIYWQHDPAGTSNILAVFDEP